VKLDIEYKIFFGGISLLVLILGGLFALMLWQPKAIYVEQENQPQYLREEEEVVITEQHALLAQEIILPVAPALFEYIEVIDGCGPYFEGECLNARSGPGFNFPVVARLRNGMVLEVGGVVERDGEKWYKIVFNEWLRYPERATGDWYVSTDHVRVLLDEGVRTLPSGNEGSNNKRIVVSRDKQTLSAYEGDELFMEEKISTGIELTPTPSGTFTIFRKTPSRYMQGPLPGISAKYWDLPGVPWNLYFTHQGAVIHGAYWHNNFGNKWSNGCVNMEPTQAEKLYNWAEIGTKVIVED
jgi:hypothetical protein